MHNLWEEFLSVRRIEITQEDSYRGETTELTFNFRNIEKNKTVVRLHCLESSQTAMLDTLQKVSLM